MLSKADLRLLPVHYALAGFLILYPTLLAARSHEPSRAFSPELAFSMFDQTAFHTPETNAVHTSSARNPERAHTNGQITQVPLPLPWWQYAWTYFACSLLVIVLVGSFFRYQLQRKLQQVRAAYLKELEGLMTDFTPQRLRQIMANLKSYPDLPAAQTSKTLQAVKNFSARQVPIISLLPKTGIFPGMEDPFVKKVCESIEAHIDDPDFHVEALSRTVHLSRSQLHRKLTALTGYSSISFIRLVRLSKAKALLENTNQSITAIAFDTGFNDPSYFGRVFKHEFGLTPQEWREQQKILLT